MKTIPPVSPEPDNGVVYWRSLEQLSDTPEFKDWATREFPSGASDLQDESTRRDFIKLMAAPFALAGLGLIGTGCRRPVEKIVPFTKQPEGYIHGVAQYYATSMPTRAGAVPLLVKSHDGRPVKVEGNKEHPQATGGTDVFAQASLLNLYDADRARNFRAESKTISREEALAKLSALSTAAAANGGEGLCFLFERSNSATRTRVQQLVAEKFPKARWFVYEPVDFDIHRASARAAYGQDVRPYPQIDKAEVILSLDCDFIGGEEDAQRSIRDFAKGRKISKPGDKMNRLYVAEPLMSQTGANADHRLRIAASGVAVLAAAVLAKARGQAVNWPAGFSAHEQKWAEECANDLLKHKGSSLVLAGHRQPLAVHLFAHAINAALGNNGKTVQFLPTPAPSEDNLNALAGVLKAGQVSTLVILGGNPAYNAPSDLDWAAAQKKAKTVVRLGYYEDETFAAGAALHLPAAHYLETWGDARTSDGTLVPVQPLIAPLFDGLTEVEVLARLAGLAATKPYDLTRETFKALSNGGNTEEKWKKFLHDGFLAGSTAKPVDVVLNEAVVPVAASVAAKAAGVDNLEVIFTRDYSLDDGRFSNNGWLQELPDPITKITWDNAVLMSRKTAAALGVQNNDVVDLKLGVRSVKGPIWIQPGQADFTVGIALGYGREKGGRIANFKPSNNPMRPGIPGGSSSRGADFLKQDTVGFNAYKLRTTTAVHFAAGATLSKTGSVSPFACTQDHWSMEGRPIVREANLAQFNKKPDFAKNMDLDSPAHAKHIPVDPKTGLPLPIYEHPYTTHPTLKSDVHQWGMSIDLNMCVGCSACVIACQSENNIPIVGKDQVIRGREMHWMRIDRYFTGLPNLKRNETGTDVDQVKLDWIDEPQVVNQPMLCQHCENAPCETVCPVNATVHDEEGLNLMTYNRCIGTRYCSNNCGWKVRRFNFFDYNKRPIENLYAGPLAKRPSDEWELLKLARNPEVSVRMRGVMEKCTFCVQRIEQAKIAQKVKVGASGDVAVRDGALKTACQQACPAEAIVFGNILDPKSHVSQLKLQARDYAVLGFLDNRARVTYLAKVRNPNPAMPDYHEYPFSLTEHTGEKFEKNASPFVDHKAGDNGKSGHEAKKGAH